MIAIFIETVRKVRLRKILALEEACKRCRIPGSPHYPKSNLWHTSENGDCSSTPLERGSISGVGSGMWRILDSVQMSGHNKLRNALENACPYKYHYDFFAKKSIFKLLSLILKTIISGHFNSPSYSQSLHILGQFSWTQLEAQSKSLYLGQYEWSTQKSPLGASRKRKTINSGKNIGIDWMWQRDAVKTPCL